MAAGIFNIAKGRLAHYAQNARDVAAPGLVVVLLSASEVDDTLSDYASLAAILTAGTGTSNVEATFTGYSRLLRDGADVTITTDNIGNNVKVDITDPLWSPTTAQALTKLLVCYDPDPATQPTTANSDIIPLFYDNFAVTTPTSGTLTYTVAPGGFYTAA